MPNTKPIVSETVFGRLVIVLLCLGFLALVGAAGAAGWVQSRNQDQIDWVAHTHDVERQLANFQILNERTEAARRGFLIQGGNGFLTTYGISSAQLPALLNHIASLTNDNARQRARVRMLGALVARQRMLQRRSIVLVDTGARERAVAEFRSDPTARMMAAVRAISAQMQADEMRLLDQRRHTQIESVHIFYLILGAAGILLAFVAISAIAVILRYTRDLTKSRNALRSLNENLEDEVADRTVNLRRANEEIQRFAYIVSHDLRSPLVNVMGFTAELDGARKPLADLIDRADVEAPGLVTQDARSAAKEDLPEAIGFIRASTQKMDRLINSILKLSREGRRTMTAEPIAVDELVEGVRASLQHRLEEACARIDIAKPLPDIVSDRLSLEQIFSNLAENAVKYLKSDRSGIVTISGRREGGRLIYEVADNGRGIDPKDHERIFDLFRRSGAQDQPGEGIGLAHVRALAYRLGGFIDCDSELDRGATFRLSLPPQLQLQPEQGLPT